MITKTTKHKPKSLVRPERRMYGMNLTKEQAEKLAQEVGGEAEGYGKKWSVWKAKRAARTQSTVQK